VTGTPTGSSLLVAVDREVCMGSGSCTFHAPNTFDLDDAECKVVVLDTRDPDELVRTAASACPTRAITIVETTSGDHPHAAR
jgi:ferredoxin